VNIDIKTVHVEPRRQTFGHIARRFGADHAASRYEEATYDLQATDNFHYRPLWEPEYEIFDPRKTAITMADWYAFKDPRQFYYAAYNIARANMQQAVEQNFAFVEKRNMLALIEPDWLRRVKDYLLPARHAEWGANMNMAAICERGYGTAITAPCIFSAADHLAIAQLVSRIGLELDGGSGESLTAAKTVWLEAPYWQDLRRLVESSFVVKDWFELFVAQTLALDGVVHGLVFGAFDRAGASRGAMGLSMLSEFAVDWYDEHSRWADAQIKTAAAENAENKALIARWADAWIKRATEAVGPLALHVLGPAGEAALGEVSAALAGRLSKIGL
jgi:phenol/toluene 2-monooxygenase (NADH) P1/A1